MVVATDVGTAETRHSSPAHHKGRAGLGAARNFEVHLAIEGAALHGRTCIPPITDKVVYKI